MFKENPITSIKQITNICKWLSFPKNELIVTMIQSIACVDAIRMLLVSADVPWNELFTQLVQKIWKRVFHWKVMPAMKMRFVIVVQS